MGGLILVQRAVPPARRQEHNDVAGFMYAVLGVAYAVLLGLMVVAVWQDYETAEASRWRRRPTPCPPSSGSPTASPNRRHATPKNSRARTRAWWQKKNGQ